MWGLLDRNKPKVNHDTAFTSALYNDVLVLDARDQEYNVAFWYIA